MVVPMATAPAYGAQSAAAMAKFDANMAARRLADAKALTGILSNAKDAQDVFGAGALGRMAVRAGGLPAGVLRGPEGGGVGMDTAAFMNTSDRLNLGGRNAQMLERLAKASKDMPDARLALTDFSNPPTLGGNMQDYVSVEDRAKLLKASRSGSGGSGSSGSKLPKGYVWAKIDGNWAPLKASDANNLNHTLQGQGKPKVEISAAPTRPADDVPAGSDTPTPAPADDDTPAPPNATPTPTAAAPVDMTGQNVGNGGARQGKVTLNNGATVPAMRDEGGNVHAFDAEDRTWKHIPDGYGTFSE